MDHLAILRKAKIKKSDNLLKDILDGTKTIESRWYVNKVAPWNQVIKGDTIYFKESGRPVTAKGIVTKVIQYENLNYHLVNEIISSYGKQISPHATASEFKLWYQSQSKKRYCILIFLDKVENIIPFEIDKKGFGISSAWIVVKNIESIKKTIE